jgi:hypothetical protein
MGILLNISSQAGGGRGLIPISGRKRNIVKDEKVRV